MFRCKNWWFILVLGTFFSCSVSKYVPQNEYLLKSAKVVSYDENIGALEMESYLRQVPNSKWFNLLMVPLYTYSMSGTDTTQWINRFLRRLGEPPVLYNEEQTRRTCDVLQQKLQNEGYLKAKVESATKTDKKKLDLYYYLNGDNRYFVRRIEWNIGDSVIASILKADSVNTLLTVGMPFCVSRLNKERERITALLKDMGYYKFRKEYITYRADTARHSTDVHLTLNLMPYDGENETPGLHPIYTIRDVYFVADDGVTGRREAGQAGYDTLNYQGYHFLHVQPLYLRPSLLSAHSFIESGNIYSDRNLDRTYRSFSRLDALKYTNIRFGEVNTSQLDAYVAFERSKQHSVSFEVEGTNTAGDLGAAASVTFSDKNLFRGSELLTVKLRGAYEAISGLEGYTGDNYFEYGAEVSLKFPGFIFPFFNSQYKNRLAITSQIAVRFNSQERPEFERQVLSGAWSYQWNTLKKGQHKLDLLDVNYIYVPWISDTFKHDYLDSISNRNSILKYNYENLLIVKCGYSYNYSSADNTRIQRFTYTVRTNVESAGNLLALKSNMFGENKNSDGQYTFLNIAYAQYVKGDVDVTANLNIDRRNSLVFHVGLGIAYPYGNSTILPFEKRYFSGGANSLRGWSIRSLGPGTFVSTDRNIDFINQSGDMKLDINFEYRTHLFWKINTAAFIDAGNIWTIREYSEQKGGKFVWNSFYNELAMSYGLGLRLELGFLVLRLDGGMKAINPAYSGRDKYPFSHPDFSRDFALHFAVGYPF